MNIWTPEEIKKLRQRYGLSQPKFGSLLGVTGRHIYFLEKGMRTQSKTLELLLDCVKEKVKGIGKGKGKRK